MNENILKHTFAGCITSRLSGSPGDYLVIYKSEGYKSTHLMNGYFDAANKLINILDISGCEPTDDKLVWPILNLYINGIEFLLKHLAQKLYEHYQKKCCDKISLPPPDFKKYLDSTHDLKLLTQAIMQMLPVTGLHSFPEFSEINIFIESLYNYGVRSVTTRYRNHIKNISIDEYQSYVHLQKMQENFDVIKNIVEGYIELSHLQLCERYEFTKERLSELIFSLKIMRLYKSLFYDTSEKIKWPAEGFRRASFSNFEPLKLKETNLATALSQLKKNELEALARGLDFCLGPTYAAPLYCYIEKSSQEHIQSILKDAHHFTYAHRRLRKYIRFIINALKESRPKKSL